MPSELLHLPPSYTLVGAYRLLTDPSIRKPVLDKIKHASIRGILVGAVYTVVSWRYIDWFIRHFLVSGSGGWFGFGLGRKVEKAVGTAGGAGHGTVTIAGVEMDLVFYTHMLILLPQLSSILRFFIYKNLRLARSRAYALTVASRGKPPSFWSQGYVEEWANPPVPRSGEVAAGHMRETKWISWILWWPVQLVLRRYFFLPLSPALPLLAPLFTSFLRSITTAEYLHQPYFETKGMGRDDVWRWVEERKWAYRAFGFAAALLESIPIAGLFLSIPNRIGAAMWAFDLEKRQHLFATGLIKPLQPDQVGFYGMGAINDLGVDIQAAEKEVERKWSGRSGGYDREGEPIVELKGEGLGVGVKGTEQVL